MPTVGKHKNNTGVGDDRSLFPEEGSSVPEMGLPTEDIYIHTNEEVEEEASGLKKSNPIEKRVCINITLTLLSMCIRRAVLIY